MEKSSSTSKEDYLSEIYKLQSINNRAAKITEIANSLDISKPSVSEMANKLSEEGLVEFEKYGGVTLTEKGIVEARKVVRKHQLLEVFFNDILKLKDKFHHEAHNVEHSLSDDAADRLDEVLKKPKFCPDGNPIPSLDVKVIGLLDLPLNTNAKVVFTSVQDQKSLDWINSLGIIPQAKIKAVRKISNGPIIISVKGSEIALGKEICNQVFVEKEE